MLRGLGRTEGFGENRDAGKAEGLKGKTGMQGKLSGLERTEGFGGKKGEGKAEGIGEN